MKVWLNEQENFYCGLTNCELIRNSANATYVCQDVNCKCIKDTFLCTPQPESDPWKLLTDPEPIDISPILDMIKGPATMTCADGVRCHFHEEVLEGFFMDGIPLKCNSGECLRPSEVPGYIPPVREPNISFIVGLSVSSIILLLFFVFSMMFSQFSLDIVC